MSQGQPTITPPSEKTVQALSAPWYARPVTWATLGGILSTLGGGATALASVFESDPHTKAMLMIVAGCFGVVAGVAANLGSVFARNAGVQSAAAVHDTLNGPVA